MGSLIWELPSTQAPSTMLLPLFLRFGLPLEIGIHLIGFLLYMRLTSCAGFVTIRPPVLTCPNPHCSAHKWRLQKPLTYHSTLFTVDNGPLPVFPLSLRCDGT
jgi:hypothetical protein